MVQCSESGCETTAAYWYYDNPVNEWRPVCTRHAEHRHPSLEIHAWLTSGYLKPIERPEPLRPPAVPEEDRANAFREVVEEAMDW